MQSMKRVLHPARHARCNWGEGQIFQRAVLGSNDGAPAACVWPRRGLYGNQAQPNTKADFATFNYTAKRIVCFSEFRLTAIKKMLNQ